MAAIVNLKGKKVALVIASIGYQPIEYGVPKKMLEQLGVTVVTVSDKPGGAVATDKSTTHVDLTLSDLNVGDYDGIFFIGGSGSLNCLDNSISYSIISQAKKLNVAYGAICIATRILAKAYGLEGKRATGWDDDKALETILKSFGATYIKEPIVTDGLVVTATDPQAAEDFAQGIIRVLTKKTLDQ